ncbi:hypothetical protein EYF80_038297 [Liparis tanakae]|uniref:Uncharacterized protein n=1 Tax=Liparis tanakae TaxID=230148 RepID=A0A4Z2GEC7_9TELE|nr:hypothetical protein EYF80_038297 [Liparis tanakae]
MARISLEKTLWLSSTAASVECCGGGRRLPYSVDDRVVALVSLLDALGTHALLVGATVQPQGLLVLRAQIRSQRLRGRNQLVGLLPPEALFVDFNVSRAVRLRARETRFNRFASPHRAHAAFHLLRPGGVLRRRRRLKLGPLKLFHHLPEDRVPAQQRSGVEHLAALRAAVLALLLGPVPVAFDAVQAVAVSTGDGRRVS